MYSFLVGLDSVVVDTETIGNLEEELLSYLAQATSLLLPEIMGIDKFGA